MYFKIEKRIETPGDRAVYWAGDKYITYTSVDADGKKCLVYESFTGDWEPTGEERRVFGENLEARDPVICRVGEKIFVVFNGLSPFQNQERCMWMHTHGTQTVKPVFFMSGMHDLEQNWSPFEYRGRLAFVYCFDPVVILICDSDTGKCSVIKGTTPCVTKGLVLRGRCNLHDRGEFYEGFARSKHNGKEFAHLVKFTKKLELWNVSEPVMHEHAESDDVQVPLASWVERDTVYVTARIGDAPGCVISKYCEKSWSQKVRDMLSK
jgi:hypothetical protein